MAQRHWSSPVSAALLLTVLCICLTAAVANADSSAITQYSTVSCATCSSWVNISNVCYDCPSHSSKPTGKDYCVCDDSYYGWPGLEANMSHCRTCPTGANCLYGSIYENQAGYFFPPSAVGETQLWRMFTKCPHTSSCQVVPYAATSNPCVKGSEGPLCAVCSPNYYTPFYYPAYSCASCRDTWITVSRFIMGTGIFVLALVIIAFAPSPWPLLKLLVYFDQVLLILAALEGRFQFLKIVGAVGANWNMLQAIDCVFGFHIWWFNIVLFISFVPWTVMTICGCIYGICSLIVEMKKRNPKFSDLFEVYPYLTPILNWVHARALRNIFTFWLLFGPPAVLAASQLFQCQSVSFMGSYSMADYSFKCYTPDWWLAVMIAVVIILVWVLILPGGFLGGLIWLRSQFRRERLLEYQDHFNRAADVLLAEYAIFGWEFVEYYRKMLLIAACIIGGTTTFEIALFLSFGFLIVHCLIQPYLWQATNLMQAVILAATVLMLFWGYSFELLEYSDRDYTNYYFFAITLLAVSIKLCLLLLLLVLFVFWCKETALPQTMVWMANYQERGNPFRYPQPTAEHEDGQTEGAVEGGSGFVMLEEEDAGMQGGGGGGAEEENKPSEGMENDKNDTTSLDDVHPLGGTVADGSKREEDKETTSLDDVQIW